MTWTQKTDKWWIGLIVGLLVPAFMFFLYWLFFHHQITFPSRFIRYLRNGYLLSNVIKICGLGNLLVFYLGLNAKMDKFNRGIIISLVAYVALIAYVTYYHEPEYI